MTSSRTLAAAGALVATLAVAGCSFSGDAQPSGGSTSATSPSTRTPAAPAKPATPSTPSTPSTPVETTSPGTSSSPPANPPARRPPPGSEPSSTAEPSSGAAQAPGAQAPTGQPPAAQAPAGPQGSAPGPCTADALDYTVPVPVRGSGGSASSTTSVVLRNTGTVTCTLYGYPGLSFVAGDDRHQVGAAADRLPGTSTRVVLVPGSGALAPLTIAANASVGAPTCQPTDAVGIAVYAPGSTASVLVNRPATVCGGADAHQLSVGPVQTG